MKPTFVESKYLYVGSFVKITIFILFIKMYM